MFEHGSKRTLREVDTRYFGVVSQGLIDDQLDIGRKCCWLYSRRHGEKGFFQVLSFKGDGRRENKSSGQVQLWKSYGTAKREENTHVMVSSSTPSSTSCALASVRARAPPSSFTPAPEHAHHDRQLVLVRTP
jgi:hypothetical protein